jgi:glycosyltransferase involved in cell wall biosynthesis
MPGPVRLSVVVIAFNEARNIGRCLDSVRGIADDVVVVDSFSTDETEAICRSKGARFVQHAFDGHVEQKSWALRQARYPHVLSLDADEAPDEELRSAIARVKEDWTHDGYTMNRLNNYCGRWIRHCGWYPDRKLRLWDIRKGRWGGVNPHDRFEMADPSAPTRHLPGNILHYSYLSVDEHRRKAEKFSTIAAGALHARGRGSSAALAALKAAAKFVSMYFLRLGFLDGRLGFVICRIAAWETWLKYTKLARLHRQPAG